MILSFQLTMPNVGSWNGKWSGEGRKYYKVRKVSASYMKKQEWFKELLEKGRDSWYHSWNDGWGANVIVEIIDSNTARKRRKESVGFAGYEWMIDNIIYYGSTEKEKELA